MGRAKETWAALPADLLGRIAEARGDSDLPVLQLEDTLRAECACRAWRAALAARPIQQRSLCLGAKHCWQGGADDPSRHKALACARWAAARKPVALGVELMIPYLPDEELAAAVSGALHALYSREIKRPAPVLDVHFGTHDQLKYYLPALASCPSLERVRLRISYWARNSVVLAATPEVPSLGNLKAVMVYGNEDVLFTLSLPMPRLMRLYVSNRYSGTGIESSTPVVVLGKAAGGLPLFPALTRLELNTGHLTMDAAAMPALRQMGLVARSPAVACDLRAATQLTSLRLEAATLYLGDSEEFLTSDSEMEAEGGMKVRIDGSESNYLAATLRCTPPTLRTLDLTLTEPMNFEMEGALRVLTGLTRLAVALHGKAPQPGPSHQVTLSLDCRLLAGMCQLEELRVVSGELRNRAALASLPALKAVQHNA